MIRFRTPAIRRKQRRATLRSISALLTMLILAIGLAGLWALILVG